ncbi:calnexin homolog 1-like, partial [Mangifera indica]|uniref:calnexin homolog 1-like n=1 Tax=Mangifera indica TaxID=29780 RepID=UPI001CFB3C40
CTHHLVLFVYISEFSTYFPSYFFLFQIFYESFDEPFDGRWIVSKKDEYQGVWKNSQSEGHQDYGLLVSQKAKKYAIVKELDKKVTLKGKKIVVQYEVRFQNGLECGGAYLKFLRPQKSAWKVELFDSEAPYSIMFGPDRCGSTDKIHFIFNHKNPKNGEYIEHHLQEPPSVPSDKISHVYTAIISPDNRVSILVDGDERRNSYLLSGDDFEPPLIPPYMIPDEKDKKPEDWDDRPTIPDPSATKPDDWDEDAPPMIEDEYAVKPEGWLDDVPLEIDDPDASKPEIWDDEEDGEWEAPKVPNPECSLAPGCGKWKRPAKKNPTYKGKWKPPHIENPKFRGFWKPRMIQNPKYFETDTPNFEPIAAIGIEIWTMQDGLLFDNILITRDEHVASSYRETTWKPKYEAEKAKQRAQELASLDFVTRFQQWALKMLFRIADHPYMEAYRHHLFDIIEKVEDEPKSTLGVFISIIVVIMTISFTVIFSIKKSPASVNVADKKKYKAAAKTSDNNKKEGETETEKEKAACSGPSKKSGEKDA